MSTVQAERVAKYPEQEWVPLSEAARRCGIGRNYVHGLVQRKLVGTLELPGSRRLLVRVKDVLEAIESAYRPAHTNGDV